MPGYLGKRRGLLMYNRSSIAGALMLKSWRICRELVPTYERRKPVFERWCSTVKFHCWLYGSCKSGLIAAGRLIVDGPPVPVAGKACGRTSVGVGVLLVNPGSLMRNGTPPAVGLIGVVS